MSALCQDFIRLPDATALLGIDYQAAYRARSGGQAPFIQRLGGGRGYLAIRRDDLAKLAALFRVAVPAA